MNTQFHWVLVDFRIGEEDTVQVIRTGDSEGEVRRTGEWRYVQFLVIAIPRGGV